MVFLATVKVEARCRVAMHWSVECLVCKISIFIEQCRKATCHLSGCTIVKVKHPIHALCISHQ